MDSVLSQDVSFIGIDNSPEMLEKCRAKFEQLHSGRSSHFLCHDLREMNLPENLSVVSILLTLMFVRPLHRRDVLSAIYQGLNPGGALILVEKVVCDSPDLNRQFIKYYYDMKRRHGYSELEISQKREALENVLMIIGFGVASNNPWYLAITLPLFFLAYACIITAEEHYLRGRFGDDYRDYCSSTPRLLPRLNGLAQTLRTFSFNWRRVAVKEYSTVCITLLVLVLLSGRALNQDTTDWLISGGLMIFILLACVGIRTLKKSGKLSARPVR
ncbi:methyltransferase domain-containing protein [Salmonella enterica subsp. enterica serovar 50:k:e,n,x,z15]